MTCGVEAVRTSANMSRQLCRKSCSDACHSCMCGVSLAACLPLCTGPPPTHLGQRPLGVACDVGHDTIHVFNRVLDVLHRVALAVGGPDACSTQGGLHVSTGQHSMSRLGTEQGPSALVCVPVHVLASTQLPQTSGADLRSRSPTGRSGNNTTGCMEPTREAAVSPTWMLSLWCRPSTVPKKRCWPPVTGAAHVPCRFHSWSQNLCTGRRQCTHISSCQHTYNPWQLP